MNWQSMRIPVVLLLTALFLLGAYNMFSRILSKDYSADATAQAALYRRSPGCDPRSSNVDPTLSPCTEAPVTVVNVATRHESSQLSAGGIDVYDLTVRDQNGDVHTYTRTFDGFGADRRPGETIIAQYWRGDVYKLIAGQDQFSVGYFSPRMRHGIALFSMWSWVMIISGVLLSLLTSRPRRRSLVYLLTR